MSRGQVSGRSQVPGVKPSIAGLSFATVQTRHALITQVANLTVNSCG